MLSVVMVSVVFIFDYAECRYAECRYAECRGTFLIVCAKYFWCFRYIGATTSTLNFASVSVSYRLQVYTYSGVNQTYIELG